MDNFKDAFQNQEEESGGFGLIDQGEYEAEISDVQLDMTKEPNRVTIEYTLTDEYAGRKVWGNYNLEGRGIGFLKKDLKTLGLDYSEIDSPESILDLLATAMNYPVIVFINQKEWQGKTYNNVYLNALNDAPAAVSTPTPLNQKAAERQATQKSTQTQKAKPPAGKTPKKGKTQPAGGDPEVPW